MSLVLLYFCSIFAINLLYFMIFNDFPDLTGTQRSTITMATYVLVFGIILAMVARIYEEWRFTTTGLATKMLIIIFIGAAISYGANIWVYQDNPDAAQRIALAAFGATLVSGISVFTLFHLSQKYSTATQLYIAIIPSAIIDSVIFSILLYGTSLFWFDMLASGIAKIAGGLIWGHLLVQRKILG